MTAPAPAPTTCPRCDGETTVQLRRNTPKGVVVVEAPCPDCCCPCGVVTGGRIGTHAGICDDCLDEIGVDTAARRREDR